MPPPYKLILFDFDGTLVDTVGDIAYYANETLRANGYREASLPQVKEAIGWGVHELFRALAPAFGADGARLEKAVEDFKKAYRARPVRATRPFPGVIDTLEGPLRAAQKGIVTNKPHDITLQILEELGMNRHFGSVLGMHAGFEPKPDPAGMLHSMRLFSAEAPDTVYVGDSRVDAETSEAAGIDFAWVDYGYQDLGDARARYRFSNAAEWAGLVS
jgi:phosphoglycolate phosphatase